MQLTWRWLANVKVELLVQGPSAVTLETLTLAHFLDRATQLAASAQEIKALDAQVRVCVIEGDVTWPDVG